MHITLRASQKILQITLIFHQCIVDPAFKQLQILHHGFTIHINCLIYFEQAFIYMEGLLFKIDGTQVRTYALLCIRLLSKVQLQVHFCSQGCLHTLKHTEWS